VLEKNSMPYEERRHPNWPISGALIEIDGGHALVENKNLCPLRSPQITRCLRADSPRDCGIALAGSAIILSGSLSAP